MQFNKNSRNSPTAEQQYPQYYGYFPPGNSNQWNAYNYDQSQGANYNGVSQPIPQQQQFSQQQPFGQQQQFNQQQQFSQQQQQQQQQQPFNSVPGKNLPQDFLANPLAGVAMQYGSKLMGTGKEMVDKEINRFVTVAKLRYFFSVDTHYVLHKLKLLLFPFTNSDWSLKYNEKSRLEPRYDHNAPDLYIPFMGYITYVLITGLVLGMRDRFSPEVLGIMASQALAWTAVEIALQLITIYFISIPTSLTFLDLLAYSGYKFVGTIICIILGLLFNKQGYLISLLYCGVTTAFFMVQCLKWRLMSEMEDAWSDQPQNTAFINVAYKRKMYFLLMIGLSHIIQIWWLSSCLEIQKIQ